MFDELRDLYQDVILGHDALDLPASAFVETPVDIPDKGAPDRQLVISQTQLGVISFIFLIGLPALLFIFGGAIWWRRRRA